MQLPAVCDIFRVLRNFSRAQLPKVLVDVVGEYVLCAVSHRASTQQQGPVVANKLDSVKAA
jgi:hypothetical protein